MPQFIATILVYLRRYGIAVIGWSVVIFGLVIGPILLVPLGVAILAWEFPWARRLLRNVKVRMRYWWRKVRGRRRPHENDPYRSGRQP